MGLKVAKIGLCRFDGRLAATSHYGCFGIVSTFFFRECMSRMELCCEAARLGAMVLSCDRQRLADNVESGDASDVYVARAGCG
jgi:hypothetical protein